MTKPAKPAKPVKKESAERAVKTAKITKSVKPETPEKPVKRSLAQRAFSARNLRWGMVVLSGIVFLWLVTWLTQRSLRTPAKKQAMRSWLDNTLNADVSHLGDMKVRVNIVRDSRVLMHNIDIEHPNPVFPGKLASIGRMGAWAPPWAITGLYPGRVNLLFHNRALEFEQGANGEWSHDGLLQPLAASTMPFPFPLPSISEWVTRVKQSRLTVRRGGYELAVSLDADIRKRKGRDTVRVHAEGLPFVFSDSETETRYSGSAGPLTCRFHLGEGKGTLPEPVAGACQVRVSSLPVSVLPFFIGGIPMEEGSGTFHGLIRYDRHEEAKGELFFEGELNGAPLAVFGLPRKVPIHVSWPVLPNGGAELTARARMGPSGFGAFEISVPLDEKGYPKQLSMRGDVAQLDDVPTFFNTYSAWPRWLSVTFPRIEWKAGKWLGFGWDGSNMQLSLTRSTAGMNLSGEGEMMGGRVRLALAPEQPDAPITIAAERLDPGLLADRLARMLPKAFRARVSGSHVNLTWRGYRDGSGLLAEWGSGMVWSRLNVSLTESGVWWHGLNAMARAIVEALPDWGGGKTEELLEFSERTDLPLDQLSIVLEKGGEGEVSVEFRAYGDACGQATGLLEWMRDGTVEGEVLLAGGSELIRAVERANPELALALDLLANDSSGLRVSFRQEPGGEAEFYFPFIQDAERVREALRQADEDGQGDAAQ